MPLQQVVPEQNPRVQEGHHAKCQPGKHDVRVFPNWTIEPAIDFREARDALASPPRLREGQTLRKSAENKIVSTAQVGMPSGPGIYEARTAAVHAKNAGGGTHQACGDLEQGRLAAARRSDENGNLAGAQRQ